jgi:hypothetical protein
VSRQENLPPDLKAVLSLLVGRHKSYAEIAGMLGIQERAVRDRAHSALALLAPRQARELSSAERELVGEYLLGQADPGQVSAARAHLESSAPARTWAQTLTAELNPLATAPLPEIPGAPAAVQASSAPERPDPPAPSSRRGGAIVLGGLATIAIVAVALIVGLGGGSHTNTATNSSAPSAPSGSTTASTTSTGPAPAATTSTPSTAASTTSTSTSAKSGKATGEPHLDATLTLTSPDPSSKAVGIIEVVSENNEHAFLVAAEHLPPTSGFRYAAWLYNSPTDAFLLGRGPTVGSNGLLKAAGGLPANAAHYGTIILTEEHSEQPRQPGQIVLSGAFKLT